MITRLLSQFTDREAVAQRDKDFTKMIQNLVQFGIRIEI